MSRDIPEHMRLERRESLLWLGFSGVSGIALMLILASWAPYLAWLSEVDRFSPKVIQNFQLYWDRLLRDPIGLHSEFHAGILKKILWYTWPVVPTLIVTFWLKSKNPHRTAYMVHGDADFGTMDTIRSMEKKRQVGRTGTYLNFGSFQGARVSLIETLSVLALAPPGTGKTAGFIIPAILTSEECSILVNDPKPELWHATSGFRAKLGPTFMLNWSAVDDPEKGLYFGKFNFLDPRLVPPNGPDRDTFVDSVAKTLIPDAKGGDTYFVDRGRAALTGFLHMIICKINDRTDEGRYESITPQFLGKDASLPMLVDWLVESESKAKEDAAKAAEESGGKPDPDPMKPIMEAYVAECIEWDYHRRAVTEISSLVNMADKERSGVLGTMAQGLLPFKNSAVAERAGSSDFTPQDLRGRLTPESLQDLGLSKYPNSREEWDIVRENPHKARWQPLSVYICINQAVAASFASITALFFQTCSQTLLAYGPGESTPEGTLMGPYATSFVIDEFAKLPKIPAVLEGPDLGRSKKTFYLLVAQDYSQIGKIYSKEDQSVIDGTTAVKFILEQNNPDSINRIASMVGKTTVKRKTISRTVGFGKNTQMFGGNQSESQEGVNLLTNSNLGIMPKGKHIILVQGFMNRPLWMKTPLFFEDEEMLSRAFNPRTGKGPPPAPPVPDLWKNRMVADRKAEENKRHQNARNDLCWWWPCMIEPEHQLWAESE